MDLYKKIFHKKKILIYGMGKTGISGYQYLKKNNQISLYDDNKNIFIKKNFKKSLLDRNKLQKAMNKEGLPNVRFNFDFEGTKVIF